MDRGRLAPSHLRCSNSVPEGTSFFGARTPPALRARIVYRHGGNDASQERSSRNPKGFAVRLTGSATVRRTGARPPLGGKCERSELEKLEEFRGGVPLPCLMRHYRSITPTRRPSVFSGSGRPVRRTPPGLRPPHPHLRCLNSALSEHRTPHLRCLNSALSEHRTPHLRCLNSALSEHRTPHLRCLNSALSEHRTPHLRCLNSALSEHRTPHLRCSNSCRPLRSRQSFPAPTVLKLLPSATLPAVVPRTYGAHAPALRPAAPRPLGRRQCVAIGDAPTGHRWRRPKVLDLRWTERPRHEHRQVRSRILLRERPSSIVRCAAH
ncbi:hypothetical protein Memar_1363 [Methanoculleus marisnigri JR1]|uniref:Uncharacterized protein n=1 Tax=Methanoculleus marisnigri (strain ATCC 35101 / DSM 1498 / JR1) TaxID=368407 RepID=A3CV92_METMJ|nr:hypothetical protein Memar_1363 [Methanoculleus marisnigri JR1]